MAYLLSVCIPSRNRPQSLLKTVAAIQQQIIAADAEDKVEVVILDNSDEDNLRVDSSALQGHNIRYFSDKGLGLARSINSLISYAKGTYVWLLGDDDIIENSAIESIVGCLEDGREKIHYLTFDSGGIWENSKGENLYFKNCNQHYFVDGAYFLEQYWLSIIFMSINVFRREEMFSHAEKYSLFKNVNEVYQNSLLCISFIDRFGRVQIIPKTLLWDTQSPKLYSPYNSIKFPVTEYLKLLSQLRDLQVSKRCLVSIKKDGERSLFSHGLRFVIRKLETKDDFDYAVEYAKLAKDKNLYVSSRVKAWVIYLLLQFPATLAKLMVKLIYLLYRRKNQYKQMREENLQWYEKLNNTKTKYSYDKK